MAKSHREPIDLDNIEVALVAINETLTGILGMLHQLSQSQGRFTAMLDPGKDEQEHSLLNALRELLGAEKSPKRRRSAKLGNAAKSRRRRRA